MQVSGVARVSTTSDGKAVMEVAGRPTFELNRVAMSIWSKLVAGHSPQDISAQIAKEFGVPEELTAKDVTRFIDQLKRHLLIYDDN
jgi:hypothetical protein